MRGYLRCATVAAGSTSTSKIVDPAWKWEGVNPPTNLTRQTIEFQQGIWRYHPVTREFELFAEGGGNTWGIDFDRHGQLFAGGNTTEYASCAARRYDGSAFPSSLRSKGDRPPPLSTASLVATRASRGFDLAAPLLGVQAPLARAE